MPQKFGSFLSAVVLIILFSSQGKSQTVIGHIYKNTPNFIEQEVIGTRYLFDTGWVKGNVIGADDRIVNNDSLVYNFDKISQNLFMTSDRKVIYEVDKKEFKSVTFYRHDSAFLFERVPVINSNDFFQVLAFEPDKYALYKFIHTTLKKANYTTNGLSESGSKYDEYVDEPLYYLVFPNKEFRLLASLKKSSVEKAFALNPDQQKVESFFSSYKSGGSAENYIENLVNFLNGHQPAK